MQTIIIPKNIIKDKELVAIPRIEYEEFLELKEIIKMVEPTRAELKAVRRGRKEIKGEKYISWHEFKQKLANNNNQFSK